MGKMVTMFGLGLMGLVACSGGASCDDGEVLCMGDTSFQVCEGGEWSEERDCPDVEGGETCMTMGEADMCMVMDDTDM